MSETNVWIKKSVTPPPVGKTVRIGYRTRGGDTNYCHGYLARVGSTNINFRGNDEWLPPEFDYYWRPIDPDPPLPEE